MSKDKMIMVTTDDSLKQQYLPDRKEYLNEEERLAFAKMEIESILKSFDVKIIYSDEDGWCMESVYLCCVDEDYDPIKLTEISNV